MRERERGKYEIGKEADSMLDVHMYNRNVCVTGNVLRIGGEEHTSMKESS